MRHKIQKYAKIKEIEKERMKECMRANKSSYFCYVLQQVQSLIKVRVLYRVRASVSSFNLQSLLFFLKDIQ